MIYALIAILLISALIFSFKGINVKKNKEKFAINDAMLNFDELMQHAKSAAKSHVISRGRKNYNFLFSRLDDNYRLISSVYKKLNEDGKKQVSLCPASEWLLDNFYIIEEQYKDLRMNMGENFFKELNILEEGPLKDYPRVFALCLELVSHSDGRIDKNQFIEFVNSYQTVSLLSMAEIWALFPMLRIALLEKVRYVCEKILNIQLEWENVEYLKGKSPEEITKSVEDYIGSLKSIDSSYIEHLLNVLKKEEFNQESILNTIKEKLIEFDTDIERVINYEHHEQAGLQITIGNCITSLRLVTALDWEEVFESMSLVEQILKDDPSSTYPDQDFESRDFYRHRIELLAKQIGTSETAIARKAVACANEALNKDKGPKLSHVGYYIVGDGIDELIRELGYKGNIPFTRKHNIWVYVFPIVLITLFISLLFGLYAFYADIHHNILISIVVGIVCILPISDIVIPLVNRFVTRIVPASFLPKLEYKNGINENNTTIVIVPTLIPNEKRARNLIEQLEVTYLANKENNIYFALVGDFKDHSEKEMEGDRQIVETSLSMIGDLNRKYGNGNTPFYFFARERVYIKEQKRWMGWERKRGAITEFNELLKGSSSTSYTIISSDIEPLKKVKYVITLDADTLMPIGTAKKLIGTISHPINKAHFDAQRGIVTEGYGLIQPRIGININSSNKSLFSRIFAGQGGVDPYANAISDVYQDLFGEGIFTGKGIYDIDVFRSALLNAIPENTVLSHDLLEGSYIRAGLCTDIELIDGYPEKYSSYMMRLHRWVRGDWQIIRWLFPTIKNRDGKVIRNPISPLSKWKILDNLRRSKISEYLMFLFIFGILFFPGSTLVWLGLGLITIFLPLFIGFVEYASMKYYRSRREKLNGNLIYGLKAAFYETLLVFIFLPYNAYMMVNAIMKTLYRVFISRKNMLEWVTAADVEKNLKNDLNSYIKRMYPPLLIVYIFLVLTLIFNTGDFLYALIVTLIWSSSPFIAYLISLPDVENEVLLTDEETSIIRRISRKTWHFYETFAGQEDNYLPPDNYQATPVSRTAHRTSPTNIGFLLISILSARDLGYITTSKMIEKVDDTLSAMEKMDKWNGHLFNWYDTKTLDVLRPRYISTVDSGNLISDMLTLHQGLLDYVTKPMWDKSFVNGIYDTLSLSDEKNSAAYRITSDYKASSEFTIYEFYKYVQQVIPNCRKDNFWEESVLKELSFLNSELEELLPLVKHNSLIDFINNNDVCRDIRSKIESIEKLPSLYNINNQYNKILDDIEKLISLQKVKPIDEQLLVLLKDELLKSKVIVSKEMDKFDNLCLRIKSFIDSTSFSKLYDGKRGLFSIGYNVDDDKLTNSYYDLLASEARITSYVSVARREVPVSHWFKLGRSLAIIEGYKGLVSWTGTMFEYFMPPLIMKTYKNTLLDETYKTVIKAQINYGRKRNVPWGTSESGFYTFDLMLNYQYKAFGVPDLGLKRGLINDMVVSPYSTALCLPFSPKESINNLKRLIENGLEGEYGLYEAVDYTPDRLPYSVNRAIVESFMAHHQGMTLIALNNLLNKNVMVERFHSSPVIKTGEFLLQERIPLRVIITKEHKEVVEPLERIEYTNPTVVRRIKDVDTQLPACHVLTNGNYTALLTSKGSGYSRKDDIEVTRWREDNSTRRYGIFIFLKNLDNGYMWSSTFEPFNTKPDKYEVKFSPDKAEYFRTDGNIETHTEICVSPEDNCEIRKVIISNNGSDPITIECTSYFETVLNNQMADVVHPAFSNLFIRTEAHREYNSIIASRRPREEGAKAILAFHTAATNAEIMGDLEFETDRYRFIGRGNDIINSTALNHPLTNSVGAVLDPIMSLRRRIRIEAKKSANISFIIGTAGSRESTIELSKKYNEISNIERAFELAYIRSQMATKYLNLKASEIEYFDSMISHIQYLSPLRLKYESYLFKNKKGQPGLWPYGISGDIPIVLVTIKDADDIDIVKDMIKAHEYWRTKGLRIDLVILNEDESSYIQPLQNLLRDVVLASNARDVLDSSGGIFIRNAALMPEEDTILLYASARLIIKADLGSVKSQIKYKNEDRKLPDILEGTPNNLSYISKDEPLNLTYFNEYGGFNIKNNEYVIRLKEGMNTPAPWINVIANKNFGFITSESGIGYTWSKNSRENKLTQWTNDPVINLPPEILYLRNESTGDFWSLTALPIREKASYTITHGMGYSVYDHNSHGINQKMTVFVPSEESIKILLVKLKNIADIPQRLSVFYYIKPVLGVTEQTTQQYIISEMLESSETILLKNPYNSDFEGRITYIDTSLKKESYTTDKNEFIGPNGCSALPEGLKRVRLSNKLGAGFYPCCTVQNLVELKPGEEKEFSIMLGEDTSAENISSIVEKYKDIGFCKKALEDIKLYWKDILETVHVKTPDLTMDIMLNSWLLYQTIACRIWARSAFYQSGGAYGFRDQLQDVMSILNVMPEDTRSQILIHSEHQFLEGDVQHWWHPGTYDKGIRTKFSDDLLWMPFVTAEYIEKTDDYDILKEETHYLEDAPLKEHEDERYGIPKKSDVKSNIYEHCIRAIERALKFGEHGIPLMGSGDWNDGMNTVGNKGRGESVWMGWFLNLTLTKFIPLCRYMNDNDHADKYESMVHNISKYIEEKAWDGQWYKRAYFDDGTPLGSSLNTECKIDSLAQTWAVISGCGSKERVQTAMHSLEDYLIRRDEGLILLFTPPFDNGDLKPGYIRGYVPGVRENGGQYTHAATWVIYAYAMMGLGDKAYDCFRLINPISHTMTHISCARYKVEPYVMAADVYAIDPHTGRGGWTWYTGSAGWMYKAGLEQILGFKKHGERLMIDPCIPKDWDEYFINYKYKNTSYEIAVKNPNNINSGVGSMIIDGKQIEDKVIELIDDGTKHYVEVTMS